MRNLLFALLALFLGSSTVCAADPPLPPIVFQSQPLGRVLGDLRTGAEIIGGEKGVKAFTEGLKRLLGEKGFQGLDMGRPFVGYVVLAPKPEDITAVVAFPVTTDKEFLELCDRVNKDKLKVDAADKTLYHMPPLDPRYQAVMRFKDRYAYIAYGAKPMPHIDSKALVPLEQLFDPAERGLVAARIHVDRVPLQVKLAAFNLLNEMKKSLFAGKGLGKQEEEVLKPVMAEFEKLVGRYVKYAVDVDSIAARVLLDQPSGNVIVEATLSGKPNTELARTIAAFKPTTNNFGALLDHPDTLGGFKLRLPLFEKEIRNVAVVGLETAQKEALKNVPVVGKAALTELFQGLARTVKTGEFDIVGSVRGPDKAGWYTVVGAIAFDDPSKLEKEFRAFVQKDAPQDVVDEIKWDAAKAGNVSIHTWKQTPGGFIDPTKVFGGADCSVAFAFAPHGIFAAMGPDAVATLKDALAVKPAPATVLDILINPLRTTKLIRKIMGEDDPDITNVENVLGKEDKLVSVMSATLEGGKELKMAFSLNLKVLPRAAMFTYLQRSGGAEKASARSGEKVVRCLAKRRGPLVGTRRSPVLDPGDWTMRSALSSVRVRRSAARLSASTRRAAQAGCCHAGPTGLPVAG